jgi:hypothetical protein
MISGSICDIVGSSRLAGGFHGIRTCSGVFLEMRWMMLKKVPRLNALWGLPSLVAKPS